MTGTAGTDSVSGDRSGGTPVSVRPRVLTASELGNLDEPIIVGHRGVGRSRLTNPYPENTLASFRRAFDEGAAMVELDVQLTGDGELVVYHDPRIARHLRRSFRRPDICLLNAEQVTGLTFRGGERVPTLREVFETILPERPPGLVFDVEVKPQRRVPAERVAEALARVLAETGARDRCVFTSFDLAILRELKRAEPLAWCGLLTFRFDSGLAQIIRERDRGFDLPGLVVQYHYSHFDIPYIPSRLTRRLIRKALKYGLVLGVYTVNRPSQLRRMRTLGVRLVITDRPALASEVYATA